MNPAKSTGLHAASEESPIKRFVKGHDFSRAKNSPTKNGAFIAPT
jgi:hypothetical protein